MNKLKVFRVTAFLFGLVPSALMCLLAWILVALYIHDPAEGHIIQPLMGLGAFAGTLGFAMAIFQTGCYKRLTVFLLSWGIIAMTWLLIQSAHNHISLALYGTILSFGVLSLWVEVTAQDPSGKQLQHASNHSDSR